MDNYERLLKIKKFTDCVGPVYGTEDFGVYLYSVIKMMKPQNVVELGTGLGSTMLWSAQALLENGKGIIHTFDNGNEWDRIKKSKDDIGCLMLDLHFKEDYLLYIEDLIDSFDIRSRVNFHPVKINEIKSENPIDILFSDFAHGPEDIIKLLSEFLPQMNEVSKIYIDSASTHYPSYHTLEKLVDMFNNNIIPLSILQLSKDEKIHRVIHTHQFKLDHIIENKDRKQNSTACISIQPYDIFPR